MQQLVQEIAERIGGVLEKRSLIERNSENAWLSGNGSEVGPLDDLIGHSITYRIAVGPRTWRKRFTLRTLPAQAPDDGAYGAAQAGGFSLHAGLDIGPGPRATLERLRRYATRPPLATERMALSASGQVRYTLKTPYRDGTRKPRQSCAPETRAEVHVDNKSRPRRTGGCREFLQWP